MPGSFGISLLDTHSNPPSDGAVVLLESPTTSDGERLVYELIDESQTLYIDPAAAGGAPRHIKTSPLDVDVSATDFFSSFDAFLESPPSSEFLSNVTSIVVDGISLFEQSGPKVLAACNRLADAADDAFILCHRHPDASPKGEVQYELRRRSDLIAQIIPTRDSETGAYEFLISKNRFGESMAHPVDIEFTEQSLSPTQLSGSPTSQLSPDRSPDQTSPAGFKQTTDDSAPTTETSSSGESTSETEVNSFDESTAPVDLGEEIPPDADIEVGNFGFETTFGGPDPPGETIAQTSSPDFTADPSEEGPSSGADNVPTQDEPPLKHRTQGQLPSPQTDPAAQLSKITDGNHRARALLRQHDINSKIDVGELKWQTLTKLASQLGAAIKHGSRDEYETTVRRAVGEVLNGARGSDATEAFIAAIESPDDIIALSKQQLHDIVTAENISVSDDTRKEYQIAVADSLLGINAGTMQEAIESVRTDPSGADADSISPLSSHPPKQTDTTAENNPTDPLSDELFNVIEPDSADLSVFDVDIEPETRQNQ